jgi:CheY-like chemotaxis protein
MPLILVVEDEPNLCEVIAEILRPSIRASHSRVLFLGTLC